MADFTEVVRWNTPQALQNNLLYGLGYPSFHNITPGQAGLQVSSGVFGKANYQYDFGRQGTLAALTTDGTPHFKFRVKIGDSPIDLELNEFEGTTVDAFAGAVIDTSKYLPVPHAYQISQSNSIQMTGAQSGSTGIFTDPATLTTLFNMSGTYGVRTNMKLTVDTDTIQNSGCFAFMELDNGINNVQIQKYHAQIRSKIVDTAGNVLGRDVDNNDIILGEPVEIAINGSLIESTQDLSDGTFGHIEDRMSDTIVTEEFDNLKVVEEAVDFIDRASLQHSCVRALGVRADYSLTGVLADMQEGLYYKAKRINGYYTMRMPVLDTDADIFSNEIVSYNFDSESGQFVYAETDDVWTVKASVPAGTQYYYFLVDGVRTLDADNPNSTTIATGVVSILTIESTRFIEFTYRGRATSVSLVGTFNNWVPTTMAVGFDPSEILKICTEEAIYYNNHPDWHKVEVTFDIPLPIVGVRFMTDVPHKQNQRVRILLDDQSITSDEWRVTCGPRLSSAPGASECAAYSDEFNSGSGTCLSAFVNNTDVITASEDQMVEWEFIQDDPINYREPKFYTKFAFWTRLENHTTHQRAHKVLEVVLPLDYVARATDFLVSDDEWPFRSERHTLTGPDGLWSVTQAVLQNGVNHINATQELDNVLTYGSEVDVTQNSVKSFIQSLNESGIALNNTEVACTLAANLTRTLEEVLEVVDIGPIPGPGPTPDPRFTRESFTRATDRLRVVIINIDIVPQDIYYLNVIGQVGNFLLEVYATEDDARNRTNRLGYTVSAGYGFQDTFVFVPDNPIVTPSGLVYIDADNIIVCFDQNAADHIFRTVPRANI